MSPEIVKCPLGWGWEGKFPQIETTDTKLYTLTHKENCNTLLRVGGGQNTEQHEMYESTYIKKNHMNEPEVRLSEISKSQKRQISYDSAYMWNFKK